MTPSRAASALSWEGLLALVVVVLVLGVPVAVVEVVHVIAVLHGVVPTVVPVGVFSLGVLGSLVVTSHDDPLGRADPERVCTSREAPTSRPGNAIEQFIGTGAFVTAGSRIGDSMGFSPVCTGLLFRGSTCFARREPGLWQVLVDFFLQVLCP
jgi:hypothetical protein